MCVRARVCFSLSLFFLLFLVCVCVRACVRACVCGVGGGKGLVTCNLDLDLLFDPGMGQVCRASSSLVRQFEVCGILHLNVTKIRLILYIGNF
jgi:hypothetical protein